MSLLTAAGMVDYEKGNGPSRGQELAGIEAVDAEVLAFRENFGGLSQFDDVTDSTGQVPGEDLGWVRFDNGDSSDVATGGRNRLSA